MVHPNLSLELNRIVDSQLAYQDLGEGDLVIIHAKNAAGKNDELYLIVAGFSKEEKPAPIFFVVNRFTAYSEKNLWLQLKEADLAQGGISANLIPELILCMIGVGGIGVGRDYSLEYINGTEKFAYIHAIRKIIHAKYELSEKVRPDLEKHIANYQRKVQKTKKRQQKKEEERKAKLLQPLTVYTINSTYELSKANSSGERTIKGGRLGTMTGRLLCLKEGKSMIFELFNDSRGNEIVTSTVKRIKFL
jgi:hypothetical protein